MKTNNQLRSLSFLGLLVCTLLGLSACAEAVSDEAGSVEAEDTSITDAPSPEADNAESEEEVSAPDIVPQEDGVDTALADSQDSANDAVVEDVNGDAWSPTANPYQEGGLLASYSGYETFVDELTEKSEEILVPLFQRLDRRVDFPSLDAGFGEHSAPGKLRVEWSGAFLAESSGEYTFKITAGDSVRFRMNEEVIAEEWDTGTYTTVTVTVLLNEGWHPLVLEYENSEDGSLIVLSARVPGGWMEAIPSNLLGSATTTPSGEAPLSLPELKVEEVWAYGANLSMTGSTAVKVSAQWTSFDGVKGDVLGTLDQFHSKHSISLVLTPGVSYNVVVYVTDLWGREFQTVPLPIQTPDPGEFVLGGLYGSYYDGAEFNALLMHRLDPQINFPQDTDGDPNGSFATPMGGNTFSIRWSGAIWIADTGTYTLYVGSSDGHRFQLDGETIFDDWEIQDLSFSQLTLELSQGWHPVQLEYFEATGAAAVSLEWESVELGIARKPIPAENLGNSYSFENNQIDPDVLEFTGNANGATSATFSWRATELCTALLFYRIVDDFTQEIITPEVSIPFDVPATGWKWRVSEIEDGGLLVGRVVIKDLLQNSDSSDEVKFEIEGEEDN